MKFFGIPAAAPAQAGPWSNPRSAGSDRRKQIDDSMGRARIGGDKMNEATRRVYLGAARRAAENARTMLASAREQLSEAEATGDTGRAQRAIEVWERAVMATEAEVGRYSVVDTGAASEQPGRHPDPRTELDNLLEACGFNPGARRRMWSQRYEAFGDFTIEEAAERLGWNAVLAQFALFSGTALGICAAAGKSRLVRRYERRAAKIERQKGKGNI